MCLNAHVVCPGCGRLVDQSYEECFYPGGYWGHMVFQELRTIQLPELLWWCCPTNGCELNQSHTTLEVDGDGDDEGEDESDEACELALSPEEVGISGAPQPSALSAEDRLTARKMVEKGETSKAVAEALGRGCSMTSKYIAAYYRPNPCKFAPVPEQNENDADEDEEFLPSISIKNVEPIADAPHPRWLTAQDRRLVQGMRGEGETKRAIAKALGKPRVQMVKYINAYIVPLEAAAVPAPSPAPAPALEKRKRSTEEPHAEPTRVSKRLRAKNGSVCLDTIVVMGG